MRAAGRCYQRVEPPAHTVMREGGPEGPAFSPVQLNLDPAGSLRRVLTDRQSSSRLPFAARPRLMLSVGVAIPFSGSSERLLRSTQLIGGSGIQL